MASINKASFRHFKRNNKVINTNESIYHKITQLSGLLLFIKRTIKLKIL